jgi:hypothetical protein
LLLDVQKVLAMLCSSLLLVSILLPLNVINADSNVVGACGLIGYPFVGLYKEIRNIKFSDQGECPADLVWQLGETEYKQATNTDKLYIVRVWCQTMMRVRLA